MNLRLFLLAVFAASPALACELHQEADRAEPARIRPAGAVAFQPAPPEGPHEGDIWIDANDGAQYLFANGGWTLRAQPIAQSRVDRS